MERLLKPSFLGPTYAGRVDLGGTVTHTQGKVNSHLDYNSKRKGAKERHFKGHGVTDFIHVRGSCHSLAVKRNHGFNYWLG